MMWDGFDKRRFPRISIRCDILMHLDSLPPISTVTENLGVGGVCVVLDERLQRFAPCRVRLMLEDGKEPVVSTGRIVWVVATGEAKARRKAFDTGIEFLNLSADGRTRIGAVVEAFQKNESRASSKS